MSFVTTGTLAPLKKSLNSFASGNSEPTRTSSQTERHTSSSIDFFARSLSQQRNGEGRVGLGPRGGVAGVVVAVVVVVVAVLCGGVVLVIGGGSGVGGGGACGDQGSWIIFPFALDNAVSFSPPRYTPFLSRCLLTVTLPRALSRFPTKTQHKKAILVYLLRQNHRISNRPRQITYRSSSCFFSYGNERAVATGFH